jgi:hypothetical protein
MAMAGLERQPLSPGLHPLCCLCVNIFDMHAIPGMAKMAKMVFGSELAAIINTLYFEVLPCPIA